jgi:hypothetical protein
MRSGKVKVFTRVFGLLEIVHGCVPVGSLRNMLGGVEVDISYAWQPCKGDNIMCKRAPLSDLSNPSSWSRS